MPAVDPLPHQLRPNDWPQPDYFTEALRLTAFRPGTASSALRWVSAIEPDLLVLPVQSQVFGWTPAFQALLGARLDRELAVRRLHANRQTDLFDAEGPYVRRFSEPEIAAFAATHAKAARVLALYIGRDGLGQAFVTLTLRDGGRIARAHRSVKEAGEVGPMLDTLTAPLPAMLAELGLGGTPSSAPPAPIPHCDVSSWELADPTPTMSPAARACHAAVMGTLLPEFAWPVDLLAPRLKTADKLAWLAQAYVEADALALAASAALRTLVWSQLDLGPSPTPNAPAAADDPVLRPLAQLLASSERSLQLPAASRGDAAERLAAAAAAGLPPFVRAVFAARASFERQFRHVDLCAIELNLPSLRPPAECAAMAASTRTRLASRGERALLDGWKLAGAVKDLRIQGDERGDPVARQRVIDSMPPRLAMHPIVRRARYATEHFESATGSAEDRARRALAAGRDLVQTVADLQRWDNTLVKERLFTGGPWLRLVRPLGRQTTVPVAWDEQRLAVVLHVDGFSSAASLETGGLEAAQWNFLRPGLPIDLSAPPPQPVAGAEPPPAPPLTRRPLFSTEVDAPAGDPIARLEPQVAANPADMTARLALALALAKTGQSVAQAQAVIDARPPERRSDYRIGESHTWAAPAHAWFFAGELEAARTYYAKVAALGTYSGSDLHARVRLRQIDADVRGAREATRERLRRYESDFARRDLAGFEFMLGQPQQAWAVLQPRLAISDEPALWTAVAAGQHIEGLSARQVRDWLTRSGLGGTEYLGNNRIGALYLHRYIVEDHLPDGDDVALMDALTDPVSERAGAPGAAGRAVPVMRASVRLKRLAFAPQVDAAALRPVRDLLNRAAPSDRDTLKALYAWVAWHADGPADPTLALLRRARLTDDLDAVLGKAVLLGLENQPDEAMRYLRAARIELAQLAFEDLNDALRPAPYTAALINYLLYRKTGLAVYRDEALLLARAYQRIFAFAAWPYALEALLAPDGPARGVAACRARHLDRGSLFLSLARPAAGRCAPKPW